MHTRNIFGLSANSGYKNATPYLSRKPGYIPGFLTYREHVGTSLAFGGVCVANHFSFLCFVFCFVWCVCLRTVSCVHNVVSVSGLSILDCPFVFF